MKIKLLSALALLASLPLCAQTPKWSYSIEVPGAYEFTPYQPTDSSGALARSGIESLNDGFGGSLWVLHLQPVSQNTSRRLDRVVWLSAAGVPIWTNDFSLIIPGIGGDEYNLPVRLVQLTRTSATLQYTSGISGDESGVNSIVSLKKSRSVALRHDAALAARENIGAVAGQNGAADSKGFFTRQPIGGSYSGSATNVVIRRYLN